MVKFTIYTEHKNVALLKHLASTHLGDFTIIKAHGSWHGKSEKTLIFEKFVENETALMFGWRSRVKRFTRDINAMNRQACCLLTEQLINTEFV